MFKLFQVLLLALLVAVAHAAFDEAGNRLDQ